MDVFSTLRYVLNRVVNVFSKPTPTLLSYKFKVGDIVIFINIFGVVFRYKISEQTSYELVDGTIVPAYHHEGTNTPWFPNKESELFLANKEDKLLTDAELQKKYGFKPTEFYGCW